MFAVEIEETANKEHTEAAYGAIIAIDEVIK